MISVHHAENEDNMYVNICLRAKTLTHQEEEDSSNMLFTKNNNPWSRRRKFTENVSVLLLTSDDLNNVYDILPHKVNSIYLFFYESMVTHKLVERRRRMATFCG